MVGESFSGRIVSALPVVHDKIDAGKNTVNDVEVYFIGIVAAVVVKICFCVGKIIDDPVIDL